MAGFIWSIHEAKNRFSAVIEAARRKPQMVTKHGRPTAVVVSAEEYERLKQLEKLEALPFNEHLLAMPVGDEVPERLLGDLREPGF